MLTHGGAHELWSSRAALDSQTAASSLYKAYGARFLIDANKMEFSTIPALQA